MRTLRAENLKHTNDISRLSEKHTEAKRKLDIAEASEALVKTQLKSADVVVRNLKEEVVRTKTLVSQGRAACATEVRRRDRQIDTLKKQLGEAGRARGSRGNPAVTTITVVGDVGEERGSPMHGASTGADDYDLRQETNAFLAKLAQNLSEENEAILTVMRRTMQQLREMSGWNNTNGDDSVTRQQGWEDMAAELDPVLDHMRTILTNPSFVPIEEVVVREEEISRLKDGWVKMENRWTEAVHLIDGWRKRMAANGRPVCDEELQMGLRLSPVRVRDVEETRQALPLRLSAVVEEDEEEEDRGEHEYHDEEQYSPQSPCPLRSRSSPVREDTYDHLEESDVESNYDGEVPIEEYDIEEPNVQILQQSTAVPIFTPSVESSPLPEPPQLSPLKDSFSAGNRQSFKLDRSFKKAVDFTTIAEENTWDLAADSGSLRPSPQITKSPTKQRDLRLPRKQQEPHTDRPSSSSSLDEVLLVKTSPESPSRGKRGSPRSIPRRQQTPERNSSQSSSRSGPQETPNRSPRRNASRLPLPRNIEPPPQQSPLTMATIAAKLAASEREADAARVRAKLKAARGTRGVKKPTLAPSQPEPEPEPVKQASKEVEKTSPSREDVDPIKHDPGWGDDQLKPEKRRRDRRTSKVSSRRRSTLSPWELESLMTGNMQ